VEIEVVRRANLIMSSYVDVDEMMREEAEEASL
jgi:hypothetical protein